MATVTHRISTPSSNNAATYTSGAFTPAQGELLVAFCSVSATAAGGALTASANGITFTQVATAVRGGGVDKVWVYVANQLVPSSPSSMAVTMDVTGDNGTGATVMVASVSGMSRTGAAAVRQFKTVDNAAIGTPQIVFDAAPLTGNVQMGIINNATNPAGLTPPSSWTEGADDGYTTPDRGAEYAYRNSGGTTATITWGSSSGTAFGGIIVELDTSASSASLPTAAETDTTQALTGAKSGTAPTTAGTDTAQPVTGAKAATAATVTETDTAQPLTGAKAGALPSAAETDAAGTLSGAKSGQAPVVAEVDTARSVAGAKAVTSPVTAESDTALGSTGVKSGTAGQAAEADQAQPLTGFSGEPRDITVVDETPPTTGWLADTAPVSGWSDGMPTTSWSDTEPVLATPWADTEPFL